MAEKPETRRKARPRLFVLLSQSPEMHIDNNEAEEHQRFDKRKAYKQGYLNAVIRAWITSHAFASRRRDTPLAYAAQSRRYPEPDARANVGKSPANITAFSRRCWRLRKRSHRRKERGHQSEAETNQVTFHCFLL
jgi:hypothetical protein